MSTDTLETPHVQSTPAMSHEPEFSLSREFDAPVWTPVDTHGAFLRSKYFMDSVLAGAALMVLAPVICLLWALIRATSAGPGFYRQRRVGLNGREFVIYKLRTMFSNAEAAGIQWCKVKDSRITPLGYWLRRLHLDELPQLFNVMKGEMSFVGPRPERPEIIVSLEKLIPQYHRRHNIKPGITGLAQINLAPDHNINDTRDKQILDVRYARMASPWLDARMIFATALRMVGIRGELVIWLTGLKQTISQAERMAVGYQFGVDPEKLWNPTKGPVDNAQGDA